MPKLVEMLYVGALSFGSEIFAKLIHFFFGILILISIYKISRKFISEKYSLIAAMIFYSSLVVGWESIAAYVDLSRTFFEIMAFWGFLNWFENKKNLKWLIISGIMLGFAITAKLIAFESLIIFLGLFIYEAICRKTKIITFFKDCFVFVLSSLIIPLPWFIFSYVNTGNPFYPYFSKIAVDSGQTFSFPNLTIILKDFYNLFLNLSDPISPLYLILLPLIFISLKKSELKIKLLALYMFLSILIWYLTLEARGGRFVLPYLPVFSIIASYSIYKLRSRGLRFFLIIVVVLIFLSSISYRYLANSKFIPVILGQETKSKFLIKNLNFSFGDFYDTDGYLRKKIKPSDNVLLFGFHNLYYIDFPFVDSSFVKKGDVFDYIAVQNSIPPARFSYWKLIYSNNLTKVKLYSKGGKTWVY
jgi:4-amino-4-deoxy-L-arabinose transferase-like glycosyltransferase